MTTPKNTSETTSKSTTKTAEKPATKSPAKQTHKHDPIPYLNGDDKITETINLLIDRVQGTSAKEVAERRANELGAEGLPTRAQLDDMNLDPETLQPK